MLVSAKKSPLLILALITLAGGWLRFSAIDFGLPQQYRPDEELLVPKALNVSSMSARMYPEGHVSLVRAVLRINAMGHGPDASLPTAYQADNNARAYLIARKVSAAMGTLTIPVVYAAAAYVAGPVAAIFASGAFALSFLHVRDSKFAKTEAPALLWLACSMFFMLRIARRSRLIDYGLAGFFCGLAGATHYTSAGIAVGIVIAHLEARRREGRPFWFGLFDLRIWVAGLLSVAMFLALDLVFLTNWTETVHTFLNMRSDYALWNHGVTPAGFGWRWLLFLALPRGLGTSLTIFLIGALALYTVIAIVGPWRSNPGWAGRPGTLALIVFILSCFFSLTSGHPQLELRYLLNPLPAIAVLAGIFASDLVKLASARLGRMPGGFISVVGSALLLAPSLVRDVQMNHLLKQTDTRTIARQWMLEHIPAGTSIAMFGGDGYGKPKFDKHYYDIVAIDPPVPNTVDLGKATWAVSDFVVPKLILWSKGLSDVQAAELKEKGSLEFEIDSLRPGAPAPIFDPNDAFYIPFEHINSMTRPGPRIRIWKMTAPSSNG